jgi:hypothetical protein
VTRCLYYCTFIFFAQALGAGLDIHDIDSYLARIAKFLVDTFISLSAVYFLTAGMTKCNIVTHIALLRLIFTVRTKSFSRAVTLSPVEEENGYFASSNRG